MSDNLDLTSEVERLFKEKMKEFLLWANERWAVSEKERSDEVFRDMSDERFEGYNDGIRSMTDALGVWLEEFPF